MEGGILKHIESINLQLYQSHKLRHYTIRIWTPGYGYPIAIVLLAIGS